MSRRIYLPELDGLRFVAFLLVFIHHLRPLEAFPILLVVRDWGWMGVELFFVISAYLFFRLLREEREQTGGVDITNFFVRRVLRIWPLYFAYLGFAVAFTMSREPMTSASWARAGGMALFSDNFLASVWGYSPLRYSAHLWTLSAEEQFYVLIPVLFIGLVGLTRRAQAIMLVVSFAIGVAARAILYTLGAPSLAMWVIPLVRPEALVIGMMLGLGWEERAALRRGGLPRLALWITCGLLVAVLISNPNNRVDTPWLIVLYTVSGLVAGAVFLLGRFDPVVRRILSSRPAAFLGKISYGLYVFHFVGIDAGDRLAALLPPLTSDTADWALRATTSFLATLLLSVMSYYVLERPFLRLKRKFTTIANRRI